MQVSKPAPTSWIQSPYSAPIKLLGKNAQTVPMTERMKEMVMAVVAVNFSTGVISSLKSFR
jgi:hypothetical protein